jgi:uncharacterized protein involved in exopolysaccharide biosynthesis
MRNLKPLDVLNLLIRWRRVLYLNVVVVTVLALVLSFVIPRKFTSRTAVFPILGEQGLSAITQQLTRSSLSSLISFSAIPTLVTPSDYYAALLRMRSIQEQVMEENDLFDHYGVGTFEDAQEILSERVELTVSPVGIIEIMVTEESPELAQSVARSLVQSLDDFNQKAIMSRGRRMRVFVEGRLEDARAELAAYEDSLRAFQETHRTVALEQELEMAIEVYAGLKAEALSKELELDLLRQVQDASHPEIQRLERELQELGNQLRTFEEGSGKGGFGVGFGTGLSQLPEIALQYARLYREVTIKGEIYAFLIEQLEQAKVMESKDTPTLQVIDEPMRPERESAPRKARVVGLSLVLSLILGVLSAFYLEYAGRTWRSDAGLRKALLDSLRRDVRSLRLKR